jgi:malate synthase
VWQWRKVGATLDSGELVDGPLIEKVIGEQLDVWKAAVGDNFYTAGKFVEASEVFRELALADELEAFLTLPAYAHYFAG